MTLPVESAAFSLAHASRSLHSWLMSETSLPSSSSQSARYFSTSALAFANCAFASSTGEAFSVVALSIASISSLKMGRDFLTDPFFRPASNETLSLVIFVPFGTLIALGALGIQSGRFAR